MHQPTPCNTKTQEGIKTMSCDYYEHRLRQIEILLRAYQQDADKHKEEQEQLITERDNILRELQATR